MKKYFVLLFSILTISCYSQHIELKDEQKHFYGGAVIAFASSTIINKKIKKPILSSILGSLIAGGVGVGKEYVYDKYLGYGVFNRDDYKLTGWGGLNGSIVFLCIINFKTKK